MGVITAVISNADSRIRSYIGHILVPGSYLILGSVLEDLNFPSEMDTIVLSEEEGVEKPASQIFHRAINNVNAKILRGRHPLELAECLHIGDELIR